jgi:hypothetical protein
MKYIHGVGSISASYQQGFVAETRKTALPYSQSEDYNPTSAMRHKSHAETYLETYLGGSLSRRLSRTFCTSTSTARARVSGSGTLVFGFALQQQITTPRMIAAQMSPSTIPPASFPVFAFSRSSLRFCSSLIAWSLSSSAFCSGVRLSTQKCSS